MKILSFAAAIILCGVGCTFYGEALNTNSPVQQPTHANKADRIEQPPASQIARFETLLESLRQELKIPAYSAAIVKDQKVVWAKGFGYADVENKIPATEHTAYHLASLTKTFASTIVMQLVQE